MEFPCLRKDGMEIECMIRAARIGKQLKERRVVITYENITDRKAGCMRTGTVSTSTAPIIGASSIKSAKRKDPHRP